MGHVPTHLYIVTSDKRFEASYRKEEQVNIWGIAISVALSLGILLAGVIYSIVAAGG